MEYLTSLPWHSALFLLLIIMGTQIFSVSIYLHREQTHRAIELHPAVRHFFRFFNWFGTSMVTQEWVAVHRKHHVHVDEKEDPHSPKQKGLWNVLRFGVQLYVNETKNPETIKKHGKGTVDDWLERNVYAHPVLRDGGVILLFLTYLAFFSTIIVYEKGFSGINVIQGVAFGASIAAMQLLVIPILAAGVINGLGHFPSFPLFYRNFDTEDTSMNAFPWGILIGGEELHNNHHKYPMSAKFSHKWYEFDSSWLIIRILSFIHLCKIRYMKDTFVG